MKMKFKILLAFGFFFLLIAPSVYAISSSFLSNAQKWYNSECTRRPDRVRGKEAVLCYSFDKLKELQQNNDTQELKIAELEERIETLEVLNPSLSKRVFLTSTSYNGNLGGLSGADAKCQERADAASLGGNWKAWLSDASTSASGRISHSLGQYKLIDGSVVANNWNDLTDGSLQVPINKTELNTTPNFGSCVWTSTNPDGSRIPPSSNLTGCSNYTQADTNYSWCGHNSSSVVNDWTKWSTDQCNQTHPIYCFEQ